MQPLRALLRTMAYFPSNGSVRLAAVLINPFGEISTRDVENPSEPRARCVFLSAGEMSNLPDIRSGLAGLRCAGGKLEWGLSSGRLRLHYPRWSRVRCWRQLAPQFPAGTRPQTCRQAWWAKTGGWSEYDTHSFPCKNGSLFTRPASMGKNPETPSAPPPSDLFRRGSRKVKV